MGTSGTVMFPVITAMKAASHRLHSLHCVSSSSTDSSAAPEELSSSLSSEQTSWRRQSQTVVTGSLQISVFSKLFHSHLLICQTLLSKVTYNCKLQPNLTLTLTLNGNLLTLTLTLALNPLTLNFNNIKIIMTIKMHFSL